MTNEGDKEMEQTSQDVTSIHRIPVGRIVAVAFAVGGLSTSVVAASPAGAVTSHQAKTVVISIASNASLGKYLVSGRTLYVIVKASKSACTTKCLKIWPAFALPKGVTKATAGIGVSASKLGTVTRAGGIRQVTYSGKPLYLFSGDKGAGQVHGNVSDTWGTWSAVVTVKAAKSSSSTGSGSTNTGTGGAAF
jgi:predicted lipoprotein with Yx(FWY)xxD motif